MGYLTLQKIGRFTRQQAAALAKHGCALSVHTYDHRPTWHALLVDDDLLYYSTAFPGNQSFASPQGGVEVVSADAGEASAMRIRHFMAWFDALRVESLATIPPTP
jgi:hypothetical protein